MNKITGVACIAVCVIVVLLFTDGIMADDQVTPPKIIAGTALPDTIADRLGLSDSTLTFRATTAYFSSIDRDFHYLSINNHYTPITNANVHIKTDNDIGPKSLSLKVYRGCSGMTIAQVSASYALKEYGNIELGNGDWISTSIAINPQYMAVGQVCADGCWQGRALNIFTEASGVGYVEQHASFSENIFYMAPKISYKVDLSRNITSGIGYGYGDRQSSSFAIRDKQISRIPGKTAILNAHLVSAGLSYNSEMLAASLVGDFMVSNFDHNTNLTINTSLGIRANIGEHSQLASSVGYLRNDPRITHGRSMGKDGYYLDVAALRDFKYLKCSAFFFGSFSSAIQTNTRLLALGMELKPSGNTAPFIELGVYGNSHLPANIGYHHQDNGYFLFLGIKAKMIKESTSK